MKHTPPTMTIDEGMAIQREQLDAWKSILKPELHAQLEADVRKLNKRRANWRDGYDVPRGTDIDNIVLNYK